MLLVIPLDFVCILNLSLFSQHEPTSPPSTLALRHTGTPWPNLFSIVSLSLTHLERYILDMHSNNTLFMHNKRINAPTAPPPTPPPHKSPSPTASSPPTSPTTAITSSWTPAPVRPQQDSNIVKIARRLQHLALLAISLFWSYPSR